MRFAGGVITQCKIKTFNSLQEAVVACKSGYTPETLQLDISTTENLISILNEKKLENEKSLLSYWRTVTTIGYRLLETPTIKNNSRKGKPHAIADTLHCVLGWRSITKYKKDSSNLTFWKPLWISDDTMIYC
jgi:hypothetical protein